MDVLQREISIITHEKYILVLKECLNKRHMELQEIKYAKGKIYMIIDCRTKELAYIGSTIQELSERLTGHKYFLRENPQSKYSKYIAAVGGIDMFEIVLIEEFPCRNQEELVEREMHFIRDRNPPCNTRITSYEKDALQLAPKVKKEPICLKCGYVALCWATLEKHMNKKNPCDKGNYRCQTCRFRTNNRSSFYTHRKKCRQVHSQPASLPERAPAASQSVLDCDNKSDADSDSISAPDAELAASSNPVDINFQHQADVISNDIAHAQRLANIRLQEATQMTVLKNKEVEMRIKEKELDYKLWMAQHPTSI